MKYVLIVTTLNKRKWHAKGTGEGGGGGGGGKSRNLFRAESLRIFVHKDTILLCLLNQ